MWPRISIAGLTAGILLLLCIVSSVNSFSKYGRGCSDIGCLPNEECVITSDSCSFTQREGKDCGNYPKCQRKSGSSSASSAPVNPSERTPNPLYVQSPVTRSANESANLRLKRQSGYGGGGQGGGQLSPNGMNGRGQMGGQRGMGMGMGRGSMNGQGAMGGMGGIGSGRGPMGGQDGLGGQGGMGRQGGMGTGMGPGSMNGQGAMGGMGGMGSGRGPTGGQGGMGWQGGIGMNNGGVPMGRQRGMGGIGGRPGAMGGQGRAGDGNGPLRGQDGGGQRGPGINQQRGSGMPRYGGGNMSPYNNNGYGYGNQNGYGYQGGTSVQSMSSAGEGSLGNRRFAYGQTMGSVNGRPMYGQSYYNLNGRTYGYNGNGLTLTALPNGTFLDGYGGPYQPTNQEDLYAPTESTDTISTTRFSWF